MKIVYVTHVVFPDVIWDSFSCLELAKRVGRRGHEVAVLTWNKANPSIHRRENIDGVEIWRLAGLNFKFDNFITEYPFLCRMDSILRQMKADIIHAHSHLFLTTYQAIKSGSCQEKPTIVTVHGVVAKRHHLVNLAQKAYLFTLASWIFKKATTVICLTKSEAIEIMKIGCPSEKIKIIPNAVNIDLFKPQPVREENLVVWVGRFVPEKGLEYLIEAAKIVSQRAKNVRFILIGDGPFRAKIMKLATDLGLLGKFVRFTGPLKREEVAEILGRASVFVFPSLREGLPFSVLEAMACGTPVVGSDVPGIKDLVVNGENGLLVTAKDPKMLAEALLSLLNDAELRKEMGRNARRLVVAKYGWDSVISKIEKVYYEAINECSLKKS